MVNALLLFLSMSIRQRRQLQQERSFISWRNVSSQLKLGYQYSGGSSCKRQKVVSRLFLAPRESSQETFAIISKVTI